MSLVPSLVVADFMSSISTEQRMRYPVARWAGRSSGLVALVVLAGGVMAGASAARAADHGFPYDSTLLLETKPMKGSKRVPVLQIEERGGAAIDLWCNRVQAQLVVVDNTITVILGASTEKQCEPDRVQADEDLKDILQQVANWRRDGDLLVLQGDRSLRFRLSSN
jgi:heat shock protein HslJ